MLDAWATSKIETIPRAWRGRVERHYSRRMSAAAAIQSGTGRRSESERQANDWLRTMSERMGLIKVSPSMTDGDLIEMAAKLAEKALTLGEVAPGVFLSEKSALRQRISVFVQRYGIEPPSTTVSDDGAIRRMTDELWWRRGLRKSQARGIEDVAIKLGFVHKQDQIYASDATVDRRSQQRRRNAESLENTEAKNLDTGEVYQLAELAARSVANPRIRRGELMTRIAGFEAVAKGMGHVAEFVTLTCPSKYHAMRQVEGKVEANPKHDGSTPREAQGYLSRIWQRIRAKLARLKVAVYGFRIAEPHHDGTPHWHMILFAASEAVAQLRAVIRSYALREDGTEAGAANNRVEFVTIDPKRGSAAGYVAKYVSKNIDGGGYAVQGDLEGHDAIMPTNRVEAWASTWGIRQFQQIGGPPVGIWRELRRVPDTGGYSPTIEAARAAADCGQKGKDETGTKGNWRRFVEIMGGPTVKRRDLPITLLKTRPGERWDYAKAAPYPAPLTRYGETAPGAVVGVAEAKSGQEVFSQRYRWEIRRGVSTGAQASPSRPWTCVNNCTGLYESSTYQRSAANIGAGKGGIEPASGFDPASGGAAGDFWHGGASGTDGGGHRTRRGALQ